MTIPEAQIAKAELQTKILDLVQVFEKETGLLVTNIDTDIIGYLGQTKLETVGVRIKVCL